MKKNILFSIVVLAFVWCTANYTLAQDSVPIEQNGEKFVLTSEGFDDDVANILDISDESATEKYTKAQKRQEKNSENSSSKEKKNKNEKKTSMPVNVLGEYAFSFDKDDTALLEEQEIMDENKGLVNNDINTSDANEGGRKKNDEEKEIPKQRLVVGKLFLYNSKDNVGKEIIKGRIFIFGKGQPIIFVVDSNYARRVVEKNALWGSFLRNEKNGEPLWADAPINKGRPFYIDQIRIYPKREGFLQGEFYSMSTGQARQSSFTAIKVN